MKSINLFALTLFVMLLSAACVDRQSNGGGDDDDSSSTDDDDAVSDDDDATSADDDDTAGSGADVGSTDGLDDLGCSPTNPVDVWTIELAGSEAITARIDTIAADTAFDPAIVIVDGTDLNNAQLATNDEAFPCTWLPTEFQCPEVSLMMGPGTFAVVVLSYGSCTGTIAEYQLDVRSGPSTVVPVTMVADDINPPQ